MIGCATLDGFRIESLGTGPGIVYAAPFEQVVEATSAGVGYAGLKQEG